jgi:hypothetical protein
MFIVNMQVPEAVHSIKSPNRETEDKAKTGV